MVEKLRILLIAEAANPEWVSVPLVGWSLALAIREVADVHIVTHVRNDGAFKRAGLLEGVDFTAIDSDRIAAPLWKLAQRMRGGEGKGWTTLSALSTLAYYYFEAILWRRFGQRIKEGEFDIVHRITPLSPTTPSRLARKCEVAGIPFMLGPLNGGVPWPRGFNPERRAEKEWLSYVRGLYKALPGLRATYRRASAVIAGSRHTEREVARLGATRIYYIPENGIDLAKFGCAQRRLPGKKLHICFIGRLVPYKGLDMLIEAASNLATAQLVTIDVIGDGPMRSELELLADRLAIGNAITFHGWIDHESVPSIAGKSAVFAFPSIREFGGGAVLEAMVMGLMPIVVDYAGPGEIVEHSFGVKIPMGNRASIVENLRRALENAQQNPAAVARMGDAAREHAMANYTWTKKAAKILSIYSLVLEGKTAGSDLSRATALLPAQ